MPWPTSPEVVQRLTSLYKREMLAVINGDRDTMVMLRLLWVKEYAQATSLSGGAREAGALAMRSLRDYPDGKIPGWMKLELARPLRMVIERKEYAVKVGLAPTTRWVKETLVCGHQLNLPAVFGEEKPPKRRRCSQCAREAEHETGNLRGVGVAMAGGVGA